ncbi:T9SS type A sorting domain-containing protein [Paraflavitalea sp. CAU 1676]|uniref:T9SS type A sorting domain-containing protein n=1 Tax=Paraflavitalea sp. CAU 1676 TaxID=3032598 RepID=UPI0023DB4235|nr:T9SS type A sorting domain-containing protein [Paraflavitalea sp. CAU 1676]MDF2191725.1 T9SS type A sorting domain-containing protein [Paraflavitalea sp. CAU 1676]
MKSLLKLTCKGLLVPLLYLHPLIGAAQDCTKLNFTYATKESRCMATGSIQVNVTGGSGSYNIKVTGPVTTAYTSSTNITGLAAGTYVVSVKDITTNCVTEKYNVVVPGSYGEPRFVLNKTDVTCMNGADGTVTVANLLGGRSPFTYTIVAPSPTKVGTTNTSGYFTGLIAGEYAIQLKDSCGGQQTRRVTILNYQWWIDGVTIGKLGCDSAQVTVSLKDSKGNTSGFSNFRYGVVRAAGDTVWSTNSNFRLFIGKKRSLTVVIKDPCGTMLVKSWVDPNVPSVSANVTNGDFTCNTFTATVSGQNKLTTPAFRLYNSSNVMIASNTTGVFTGLAYGSYCIDIRDNCYDTTIRRCFTTSRPVPAIGWWVNRADWQCGTFDANVTDQVNLTNPTYKLYNSSNTLIATNTTGVFNNIPYGDYCVQMKDGCYDTTITRCFSEKAPKPAVALNIATSNNSCSNFTGSVAGQTNLTNPEYCLYNASNVKIACNNTGVFDNLKYDTRYCIRVKNDVCYDTTIERCFIIPRQVPGVNPTVDITQGCSTINIKIAGQANLNNAEYCLYNANNVKISCNTTGTFNNLPYGKYCMRITNDPTCYDTVIVRCFEVIRPKPSLSSVVNISSKGCDGFTAKVTGTNIPAPKFVLYNSSNVAIDSNATGTFNNVPYGYNCIRVRNSCYDTLIERCFTVKRDIPTGGNVSISNKVCGTFDAKATGQNNIKSAQYSVYDTLGNLVATNTTGSFPKLPYGYYDLKIKETCYDTVMVRRFFADPIPISISVTATESCTFGTTDIKVTFNSGNAPYKVEVLNPVGVIVTTVTSATSPVLINALQPLTGGQQYTVIGIDNCNVKDTAKVTPKPSIIQKTKFVKSKCPSGVWENGATDIDIDVSSNMGTVTPKIIKKNNVTTTINFTNNVGTTYKFIDLEPATYIVQYSVPSCTGKIYDTIEVAPYSFPGLQQSAAYQCDNNNFSVGAVVTGGCGPFEYEIIGSIPASPSINATGQTSPVFTITNGVQYSLVRLRAVDACGNATLNDVNILPLANTLIYASSDCYYNQVDLNVDSTANATYKWYKKTSATDSVLVSNTTSYKIAYLLPTDIGTYVCHMSVNNGCLSKISYFEVTGMCGGTLAEGVNLTGKQINGVNHLNWMAKNDANTKTYIIERSNAANGQFTAIGTANSRQLSGQSIYAFADETPLSGANYYRLRIVSNEGKQVHSNIVSVKTAVVNTITLYPNPAREVLNIAISATQQETYKVTLLTTTGQIVQDQTVQKAPQSTIQVHRGPSVKRGVYMLRILAINSQESYVYKVIFE